MSSEVGTGHVAIVPSMRGFKAVVNRETQSAGASGARAFDGGFKGAGARAGRTLGRDLKSTLSASAGDLGAAEMSKLNREVSAAAAALSKTRLRQQDDAGRVRVAETRLAEAVAKSGAESSQAVAAEERLATARRAQQSTADAVTAATARLAVAQEAVRVAQTGVEASAVAASGGLLNMLGRFRDGYKDANAARSAFSGVAGSIGGLLRAVSDVTGLSAVGRLARLAAQQASRAFTSLATMVGGQLARAWSNASRWLSSVGGVVRGAFAPALQYFASIGTLMASPFINLGRRVSSWLSPVTTQVTALWSKVATAAGGAWGRLTSHIAATAGPLGSAAKKAFDSVVSAARTAATTAGQALGSGIQTVATGAVTVAAAGIGTALVSGFSRLNAIDTAQAKLRGLGNDAATVDQIMADALASVRGTAFGLGDAATVAAAAVAAQIKPGEELQAHLSRIANNASAAGISMGEMGSIFNRAATQANGVQNDVISQLADRGIPIYQALADQMGVTAGEVFKLASEGKVDFQTFSRAAEAAAGTVAKEIGTTVPGAAKNFLAAMGRIGANALEPIYGKIGPLIAAATSALAPIEERAKQLGQILLNVLGPALDWLTGLFNGIGEGASLAALGLGWLEGLIGPIAGALIALGSGGLAGILARIPLLGGLAGPFAALAGPIGIAAAVLAGFAAQGDSAWDVVGTLTGVIDSVVAALPGLVSQVASFVPQIVSTILGEVPALLRAGAHIVEALIQGLLTALPSIIVGAVNLVTGLVDAIVTSLPLIIDGAIMLVTALIQGLILALPQLVTGALALVNGLLTAIIGALPMIIEGGIQLLLALVMGIVQALPQLITAVIGLVMGLLDTIITNLPLLINAGIQLLLSLVLGLVDALPQLITAAIDLVLQLVFGLLKMLPKLIEAGVTLVVSLVKGLIEAIPQILKALLEIVAAIVNGFLEVDWLDIGVQIIEGIISGLGSMVGAITDAIGDVASAAFEGFKDFFGIASPAKRMIQPGRDVVRGAVVGADREGSAFADKLTQVAKNGARRFEAAITADSTMEAVSGVQQSRAAAPVAVGGDGVTPVNVYQDIRPLEQQDPVLAARQWARTAKEAFSS